MGEFEDKVKGKANEVAGAVTGDDSQEFKGKGQQLKGGLEGKGNDIQDRLNDSGDGNSSPGNDMQSKARDIKDKVGNALGGSNDDTRNT